MWPGPCCYALLDHCCHASIQLWVTSGIHIDLRHLYSITLNAPRVYCAIYRYIFIIFNQIVSGRAIIDIMSSLQWSNVITVTAPNSDGFCSSMDGYVQAIFQLVNMSVGYSVLYADNETYVSDKVYDQIQKTGRSKQARSLNNCSRLIDVHIYSYGSHQAQSQKKLVGLISPGNEVTRIAQANSASYNFQRGNNCVRYNNVSRVELQVDA